MNPLNLCEVKGQLIKEDMDCFHMSPTGEEDDCVLLFKEVTEFIANIEPSSDGNIGWGIFVIPEWLMIDLDLYEYLNT